MKVMRKYLTFSVLPLLFTLVWLFFIHPTSEYPNEMTELLKEIPRKGNDVNINNYNDLTEKTVISYGKPYTRYHIPTNPEVWGMKNFSFSETDLLNYGLDRVRTLDRIPKKAALIKKMVFVTAASKTYLRSSQESISLVQEYYPKHKIIFYYLDTSEPSIKQFGRLPNLGIKDLCNVEYRKFNYSRYPGHVADKHSYAWKFLIIKEVLERHDVIFWMDSSIKFQNGNLGQVLKTTSPIMLSCYTGHNNFVVTHNQTYFYIPTDTAKQRHVDQYEANNIFIVNTKKAYDNILRWMYLCSLTRDCIAPLGASVGCKGFGPDGQTHGRCHRFDQAVLNILLANSVGYDPQKYILGEPFHNIKALMVLRGMKGRLEEQFFYTCYRHGKRIKHSAFGRRNATDVNGRLLK